MSKIALMCGHGRSTDGTWDCGTSYGGNNEAALMLPITKAAVKYLRASGVTVISDADTNNNKNMIADVKWANKEKVSIYISLHCGWYKAGSGTLPLFVSAGGKKLATTINNAVMSGMGMKTRGVTKRSDLYELNYTDAYACIFETGSIKADIKKLKDSDKYGKCIAKGICDYLGVAFKDSATPTPTPQPAPTPAPQPKATIYRVRKSWADAKSQIGAYKVLANAKKSCDAHKGYYVFDEDGDVVYPIDTATNKILDACKAQSDCMKNAKYEWESKPTIEKSKKKGTCVTYVACVLQRLGVLSSGQYLWHNGKGYGTGKVVGANSKMDVKYMDNKTLKSLKSQLKAGDIILLDDNKSGVSGSGGHIFILNGEWTAAGNPYIWDNYTSTKGQKAREYSGSRKVLARVRLKESAPTYRVRKTWADSKSQVGAYKILDNAKKECDKHVGYSVFDDNGKAVYISKAVASTNGAKIAAKANEFAYTTNTSKAKYPSGSPTAAYKAGLNKAYPNRSSWGKSPKLGASCDVFVGTCVRCAGVDPKFPRGLSFSYLPKSDKFKQVSVTKDTIQNGDIILYEKSKGGGHICIYYNGKIKEAGHDNFYPKTTDKVSARLSKSGKKWVKVFRAK